MTLSRYIGNTAPSVTDVLRTDDPLFNYAGSTARVRRRSIHDSTLLTDAAVTVDTSTLGELHVRWDPTAPDVATAGEYVCWWRVTLPGGAIQESAEFGFDIDAHAPESTAALCTVDDVKKLITLSHEDDDVLIAKLIEAASSYVQRQYGRQWAPLELATAKTFEVTGRLVNLYPYDLRTLTLATLHPGQPESLALTPYTDMRLRHYRPQDGVWLALELGRYAPWRYSAEYTNFGRSRITVTGDWGCLTVPTDIADALAQTVAGRLDRPAAAAGFAMGTDMQGFGPAAVPASWAIPTSAHRVFEQSARLVYA